MKDAQAKALSDARTAKVAKLSELAITSKKLSKAEIEEKDPAKQKAFIKALSLEDLSLAEGLLSELPVKPEIEAVGVPGNGAGALSAAEQIVADARKLQEDAVKNGKALSHAEAYEKAKSMAAKKAEGGK